MPIELRTGLPGAGKTLGAVEHMLNLRKVSPERPVYCLGVTDLRDGLAIPLDEDGLRRWADLPAGSIIIVDECQKWMPAKRGTMDSPQWIRDLSTHRHLGLDFIFITQHPSLIDTYVRKLVDRHVHTVRKYGTHMVERWSWPICMQDPNSVSAKKQSENKTTVTYSKEAMQCYKSAELHTVKRSIPRFVKVGVMLLFGLPVLGYMGYWAMHHASTRAGGEVAKDGDASKGGGLMAHSMGGGSQVDVMRQDDFAKWMRPRIDGLPWSAPMFDHLEVKATPQLFCVAVEDGRCTCNTEQGTHYEVKPARCREIAANGIYNPFVDATAAVKGGGGSASDSGDAGSRSARAGDASGDVAGDGVPGKLKDRQTATAYTPPEYHEWNSDPFGSGGGGSGGK